jgi:glycosyltransferase involved in cell wall biosynthesis
MGNTLTVKVVYRNYKPLHENYSSFKSDPPEGIEFIIPKPKTFLSKFRPLYVRFGDKRIIRMLLHNTQKIFFDTAARENEGIDLYHYLHMLPEKNPHKPFVVDLEHVAALANFVKPRTDEKMHLLQKLSHTQCKKIIPLSNAAKKSLLQFFEEDFEKIKHKIEVVYPALPHYTEMFNEPDHSILTKGTFNMLFVGQNPYGKGLLETILAIQELSKRHSDMKLFVISKARRKFISKYKSDHIVFYKWQFAKHEVIKKFFMPADLFVLPTRGDTFGMVILDALSSGTPVISTLQYAIPELIDDGKNGFLVKSKYTHLDKYVFPTRKVVKQNKAKTPDTDLIQQLSSTIENLYRDRDLLNSLVKNTKKEFDENGKFSIKVRNQKLKRIYQEAIGVSP